MFMCIKICGQLIFFYLNKRFINVELDCHDVVLFQQNKLFMLLVWT